MSNGGFKRIILISDRSLETTYRDNSFVGYLSSLPLGPIPRGLYNMLYPHAEHKNGILIRPHLSLRTLQAIIYHEFKKYGIFFESGKEYSLEEIEKYIVPVHYSYTDQMIKPDDLVLVSVMDPLGLGPATSSWRFIKLGSPYHVYYFWDLISRLNRLKKIRKFKIMVGGAGVWQIRDNDFLDKYGIDYLFEGEAETVLGPVLRSLYSGDNIPRIIKGKIADPRDIKPLPGPTNLYMIEITRGCGRMCQFCAPTRSGRMRSIPSEVIKETARNFIKHGSYILNLQSEDTLRYGSSGFTVDKDAVLGLYKDLFNLGIKRIFMTHATFANIASQPDVVAELTGLLRRHGHKYYPLQPGMESGSDRLMRKLMRGKFEPMWDYEWPEIVMEGLKVCHENGWVPTVSVMIGIPGETEEDLKATSELVDRMVATDYLFIFAPLLFVPVPNTPLGGKRRPQFGTMTPLQKKVFKKMWKYTSRKITYVWNVSNLVGYEFPYWKERFLAGLGNLLSTII